MRKLVISLFGLAFLTLAQPVMANKEADEPNEENLGTLSCKMKFTSGKTSNFKIPMIQGEGEMSAPLMAETVHEGYEVSYISVVGETTSHTGEVLVKPSTVLHLYGKDGRPGYSERDHAQVVVEKGYAPVSLTNPKVKGVKSLACKYVK